MLAAGAVVVLQAFKAIKQTSKREVSVSRLHDCLASSCPLMIVDIPGRSTRHNSTEPRAGGHRGSPNETDRGCALLLTHFAWRIQLGRQQMMKQLYIMSCLQYCNCSSLQTGASAQHIPLHRFCCSQA
jgi:hypothetical protein